MTWKRICTMLIIAVFLVSAMAALASPGSSSSAPDEATNKPQPDGPEPMFGDPPTVSINSPSNGACLNKTTVTLNVTVGDPEGDAVNVSFYDKSDDSLIGESNDVGTDTDTDVTQTWDSLSKWTTYEFYVVVNESGNEANSGVTGVYSFQTYNPDLSIESPSGGWTANTVLQGSAIRAFEISNPVTEQVNFTVYNLSADTQYRLDVDGEFHERYTTDADGKFSFNWTQWSTHTFEVSDTVSSPNTVSIQNYAKNWINLTWNPDDTNNITYIERSLSEDWVIGEGTNIYNGTDTSYNDTGLTPGETYYYQLWSYDEPDGLHSGNHLSINQTTLENAMPEILEISPSNDSAVNSEDVELSLNVSDEDGELLTVTFYNSNDTKIAETTGLNETVSVTWENRSYCEEYTWYAEVTDDHEVNTTDDMTFSVEHSGGGGILDDLSSNWTIFGVAASACLLQLAFIVFCVVVGLMFYHRFVA